MLLSSARLQKDFTPALASTPFYGKLWLYVPSATLITQFSPFLLQHTSLSANSHLLFGVDASGEIYVESQGSRFPSGALLPRDRWLCFVLYANIVSNAAAGELRLDLDETTIVNQTGIDTFPTGGYSTLYVGVDGQGVGPVYLDDIVLTTTALTCP